MGKTLFGIPCEEWIYDQACNNFVQYPVPYILFIFFVVLPIVFFVGLFIISTKFKQN